MATGVLYTAARLQARLDSLPQGSTWLALNPVNRYRSYLENARKGPLGDWLRGLDGQEDIHGLEAALRRRWREQLQELAGWLEPRWRDGLEWLARLPALPQLRRKGSGLELSVAEAADPWLAEAAPADPEDLEGRQWASAWLQRLPAGGGNQRPAFRTLADEFLAVYGPPGPGQLGLGGLRERYLPQDARLRSLFHQHVARPPCMFAYLGLVALTLHRLRGELVARQALPEPTEEEPA